MIGSEVERLEEDHADVEFFPNRPDLFSVEGVARVMRGFLGIPDRTAEIFGQTFRVASPLIRSGRDPAPALRLPLSGKRRLRR